MNASNYIESIPLITRALFVVNVGAHVINFLFSVDYGLLVINGALVIYRGEYYRIISATFTHGGILHIFFNMSSLLQLGVDLERQFGSWQFLLLTLWSILLAGLLYVLICWFLTTVTGSESYMHISSVGYSGVLFTYALIESYHTIENTRSFFGIFNVPAKIYPWILLIALQILLPNISFFGHLSGILVGLLAVYGFLELVLISPDGYLYLDTNPYLSRITRISSFVNYGNKSFVKSSSGGNPALAAAAFIFTAILNVLLACLYAIGCPVDRLSATIRACWLSLKACFDKYFCCLKVLTNILRRRNEDQTSSSGLSEVRGGDSASAIDTAERGVTLSPMVVMPERIVVTSSKVEYTALSIDDDSRSANAHVMKI